MGFHQIAQMYVVGTGHESTGSIAMPKKTGSSAAVETITYDEWSRQLDIALTTGRLYRYFDVPPDIYAALMDSDSKGRFYNERIRDAYRCERLSRPRK
jgi:hypothetical protein